MKRFKLRVALTMSAIIALIIVVLSLLNFNSFKEESVKLNKDILQEKNLVVDAALTEKFTGYRKALASINISPSDIDNNKKILSQNAQTQLQTLYRNLQEVSEGAYIINREGLVYTPEGTPLDFNIRELKRTYWNAIFVEGKQFYASAPFVSGSTNKQILVFAYKLDNDTASIVSVYLDSILGKLVERKDMFLYTPEGTILIAPYKDFLGKDIKDVRPLYSQFNEDNFQLNYSAMVDGKEIGFSAFWGDLGITGWEYVTFVKTSVIEQEASDQLTVSLLIGLVSLFIASGIVLLTMAKLVLNPVGGAPDEIASFMRTMAIGDLTHKFTKTGKETGIYLSLIELSTQLSNLIKHTLTISESVSSASTELNSIMNETKSNSQQELAQVEQISTAINELSSTSNEVSGKAVMAEEAAREAQDNVISGKQTLEKNVVLTSDINASVSESATIINELREFAIEIGSVIEVINSISDQTNLLALNAAIEAARAGEHGRGFAVVADEVRELASKTQKSTVSIKEIIEKLQSQSEKATENMATNVELINESVELTEGVKAAFESISAAVDSISEINTLVATASQEQNSVTEEISQNTTQAYDLVQQNVSAIDDTLLASSELAEMAVKQKDELSNFTV